VTLEDLVEEIVGEFRGPFEARPPAIQTLPDGSALVDGLALIDEINEHFGLHLHDPNYDTIAGYVLGRLGRIPKVGDVVEDAEEGIRLEVESMDRLRIARLVLRRLPSPVRDELREK
jgi:CBS domain containing-hemolysin-like protein